jgi:hypothetical protein
MPTNVLTQDGYAKLPLSTNGTALSLDGPVGIGTKTPDASAQLEVAATGLGFLPPVMTTILRDLIAAPASGLTIFNSTTLKLEAFDGTSWVESVAVPGTDTAVTISARSRFIHLSGADASNTAITMTATYPGHRVVLKMLAMAGGGSYTAVVVEGTLTLNATDETAEIYCDGTVWHSLSLLGATIV